MKKITFLSTLLCVFTMIATAQSVRINALVEGDCPTGETTPDVIEVYVDGTVDVTNLKVQYQFAFSESWNLNDNIGVGEYTDSYLYIVSDIDVFNANFPGIGTPETTSVGTILFSSGGGDKVRIVDISTGEVIDIFGFDGVDGESEDWNFNNSYVKRNEDAPASATFIRSDWSVAQQDLLLFEGVCWEEAPLNEIIQLQSAPLSVNDFGKQSEISISPNPTSGVVSVHNAKQAMAYTVYTVTGQKIHTGTVDEFSTIDLSAQNNGFYFVTFNNGTTIKLIKR